VKLGFRSRGVFDFCFFSDISKLFSKLFQATNFYKRRARRNELTAKNMNIAATAMATPISQRATS
jgi:hypothetical protein